MSSGSGGAIGDWAWAVIVATSRPYQDLAHPITACHIRVASYCDFGISRSPFIWRLEGPPPFRSADLFSCQLMKLRPNS
jgi:hypothetical protein